MQACEGGREWIVAFHEILSIKFRGKISLEELTTAFRVSLEFRVKSAFLERCSLIWHETSVAAPMQSSLHVPKDRCCSRR